MTARVTRFEIHASEPQKLMKFYEALFGWRFHKEGPMGYWVVTTGPTSEPGIDGGLVVRPGPPAMEATSLTLRRSSDPTTRRWLDDGA